MALAHVLTILMLADVAASPDSASPDANQSLATPSGLASRCMARPTTDPGRPSFSFIAIVGADDVTELSGKGFAPASCPSGTQFADYKARMCKLAEGNDAVQARTEQVLGVTGTRLCASALKLAGEQPTGPSQGTTNSTTGN